MKTKESIYNSIIDLLEKNSAEYKLFEHEPALTYEALLKAQKECGFIGTEAKCMVLKGGDQFIVYVTIQGNRVKVKKLQEQRGSKKIRLADGDELRKYFKAEPGCAYPFGFDSNVDIFIDPIMYEQEWILFSPVYPSRTIQVRGEDLKKVFKNIPNNVVVSSELNE